MAVRPVLLPTAASLLTACRSVSPGACHPQFPQMQFSQRYGEVLKHKPTVHAVVSKVGSLILSAQLGLMWSRKDSGVSAVIFSGA